MGRFRYIPSRWLPEWVSDPRITPSYRDAYDPASQFRVIRDAKSEKFSSIGVEVISFLKRDHAVDLLSNAPPAPRSNMESRRNSLYRPAADGHPAKELLGSQYYHQEVTLRHRITRLVEKTDGARADCQAAKNSWVKR